MEVMKCIYIFIILLFSGASLACDHSCESISGNEIKERKQECFEVRGVMIQALDDSLTTLTLTSLEVPSQEQRDLVGRTLTELSVLSSTRLKSFNSCSSFLLAYGFINLGSKKQVKNVNASGLYGVIPRVFDGTLTHVNVRIINYFVKKYADSAERP